MILSFHPIVTGEENINCAGRPPGPEELEAVNRAAAIIVPQGVREDLYRLCRTNCPLVWPNYDARFANPGKVGQALLFAHLNLARPRTVVFPSTSDFYLRRGGAMPRPFLLKTNHSGQGAGVFPIRNAADQSSALKIIAETEKQGRGGFIQQELLDHGGRDLRVVIIGDHTLAYWRRAKPGCLLTNLAVGGQVDFHSDPALIEAGITAAREMALKIGTSLAGLDLVFDDRTAPPRPLLIEINYYFGRQAFGGSENYYHLLKKAAAAWLKSQGLKKGKIRTRPIYSQRD